MTAAENQNALHPLADEPSHFTMLMTGATAVAGAFITAVAAVALASAIGEENVGSIVVTSIVAVIALAVTVPTGFAFVPSIKGYRTGEARLETVRAKFLEERGVRLTDSEAYKLFPRFEPRAGEYLATAAAVVDDKVVNVNLQLANGEYKLFNAEGEEFRPTGALATA